MSKAPISPQPDYICSICGMLIESGHKHTRKECFNYFCNPLAPDLSAGRILPSRNYPHILYPIYYDDKE